MENRLNFGQKSSKWPFDVLMKNWRGFDDNFRLLASIIINYSANDTLNEQKVLRPSTFPKLQVCNEKLDRNNTCS